MTPRSRRGGIRSSALLVAQPGNILPRPAPWPESQPGRQRAGGARRPPVQPPSGGIASASMGRNARVQRLDEGPPAPTPPKGRAAVRLQVHLRSRGQLRARSPVRGRRGIPQEDQVPGLRRGGASLPEPTVANSNASSSTVLSSGNRGMLTWVLAGQERGDTPRSPSQTPSRSENFGPLGVAVFVPLSNANRVCGSSRSCRTGSAV